MNLLVFVIGIAIPLVLGWLVLLLIEQSQPVLGAAERWFWALILGPTLSMLIVFVCHVLGLTKLNLWGFLLPLLIALAVLALLAKRSGAYAASSPAPAGSGRAGMPLPKFVKIGIILLSVWTLIKLLAGAYDLVSVPTYWDDSFNNWNMRGKLFFVSEKIVLEIPVGNGLIQSSEGVSSYPPTLPMLKTWLSVLRGSWQEPLVNGLHLLWLVGLLGSFFFALRRRLSPLFSLGGVYLLVSLPLLLIQATNPYADIFLASHIKLAALCAYFLIQAHDERAMKTWLKLSGLCLGLLLFTKNEANVLYVPLLALLLLWSLMARRMNAVDIRKNIGLILLFLIPIALPWLAFKWLNGLSFGNAKSVSSFALSLHPDVFKAVWFHLSHEPNWLLVPLVLPLSLWVTGKDILKRPEGVLAVFVVVSVCAQFLIYLLTPLATEAIMQTGLSRGLLHVAPVAMLMMIVVAEKLMKRE